MVLAQIKRLLPFIILPALLQGCAGRNISYDEERAASFHVTFSEERRLGQLFDPGTQVKPSAAALVRTGEEAFLLRKALIKQADRSIDIQVYIWDIDDSGIVLAHDLIEAAERGVRVRILLDHITSQDTDIKFANLDIHPNIEVRLFNPFEQTWLRELEFLSSIDRLNHRMHNKAFIADNTVAIAGGRNIGNHYFGVDRDSNFRDLDVLLSGQVVNQISDGFDRYWNSSIAVPVRQFVDQEFRSEEFADKKQKMTAYITAMQEYPYVDIAEAEAQTLLLETRAKMLPVDALAIYDDPEKLHTEEEKIASSLGYISSQKEHELIMEAAYVVPGEQGIKNTRAAHLKGVKQRLLTNSLATNDVLAAHAGYSQYRRQLLENNIELYELRPDADSVRKKWSILAGRSRASLHSKIFVIDRRITGIGSFNLDPRSVAINTEIVVLIDDPAFAKNTLEYLDEGISLENSYRVTLENEVITWTYLENGREVSTTTEPGSTAFNQLMIWFLGLLPIEDQL